MAVVLVLATGCDTATEADFDLMDDAQLSEAMSKTSLDELPEGTTCRTANAWVDAHPEVITSDVALLYDLPRQVQLAVFQKADASVRAQTVRNHIGEFLKTESFNAEQIEYLEKITSLISDDLYETGADGSRKEILVGEVLAQAGTREDLEALFGKERARDMFTSIRRPNEGGASPSKTYGSWCQCSMNDDWCSSPTDAPTTCYEYSSCSDSALGCGTLMFSACNGDCSFDGS